MVGNEGGGRQLITVIARLHGRYSGSGLLAEDLLDQRLLVRIPVLEVAGLAHTIELVDQRACLVGVVRLRRRTPAGFERRKLALPPRSLYRLSDEVRWVWDHSIAPMEEARWSITFRTLR